MKIKWYNVTCDNSKHIVKAQQWLFNKYLSTEPNYLDVGSVDINKWGVTVAELLPDDDYIIFGLDDFLPIDKINYNKVEEALQIMIDNNLERFELGWGASKKKGFEVEKDWLRYGLETPYKVSCQFSIWKTEALKRELNKISTPWAFEINGNCTAGCFEDYAFRWIEESAISGRQKGKVNLCGMTIEDEEELINLNLINKNDVIYGWKGGYKRTKEAFGTKYKEYYD
jgi:hypothetical protein